MADVKAINKVFRQLFRELLDMPENSVRPANQGAPAGSKEEQFATVLITNIDGTLWGEYKLKDEEAPSLNVAESVTVQYTVSLSVQFFRGDAYTKAQRLGLLLQTSSAIARMQTLGVGLVGASTARNLTAVVDTYWEERGQIDLEFHLIAQEIMSVPTYGTFRIDVSDKSSTTSSEVTAP